MVAANSNPQMTVQLTVKPRDVLADGRVNIYLALRVPGQRKPALRSTGRRIFPDQWDAVARSVRPATPNAALINNYLREQLQRLEAIILQREQQGLPLTYQHVLAEYSGKTIEKQDCLLDYMREKAEILKPQVAQKTYED